MRRFVRRMISVLIWLVVAGSTVFTQTKAPDVIIVNAKIYTVDSKFSTAEGVAITDGKFTAVGTTAQIRKLSGPSTRILDAGGKTIVPGLQDNHLHNAWRRSRRGPFQRAYARRRADSHRRSGKGSQTG